MSTLRIVVGVDGSAESRHVIEQAAVLTRALGTDLHAVHVYELDVPTPRAYGLEPVPAARSRLMAQERMAVVLASLDPADRGVVSSYSVICGSPGRSLVAAAQGAQLLVVGSRGEHSALRGLLTGSVADYCVRRAPCPVLVVPPHLGARPGLHQVSSAGAAPAR
jgi:nucleotide-binding universal stress UspA family protein